MNYNTDTIEFLNSLNPLALKTYHKINSYIATQINAKLYENEFSPQDLIIDNNVLNDYIKQQYGQTIKNDSHPFEMKAQIYLKENNFSKEVFFEISKEIDKIKNNPTKSEYTYGVDEIAILTHYISGLEKYNIDKSRMPEILQVLMEITDEDIQTSIITPEHTPEQIRGLKTAATEGFDIKNVLTCKFRNAHQILAYAVADHYHHTKCAEWIKNVETPEIYKNVFSAISNCKSSAEIDKKYSYQIEKAGISR